MAKSSIFIPSPVADIISLVNSINFLSHCCKVKERAFDRGINNKQTNQQTSAEAASNMSLCGITNPCFPKTAERAFPTDAEDEVPVEINYDSAELTMLYQAIEDKAFMAAIDFLESGQPEVYDECRTWVTRYEKENPNKIRWSQLPIHAAVVFGGPPKLIQLLADIYPKGVRCTDDRSMLPIHLAFRKESSDAVIHCLLTKFPESINAKDSRGRTPLQVQTSQKAEIISMFEENAKMRARKALTDEKVSEVQKKLTVVEQLNSDLQNKNELLDEENKTLKDQLDALKEELSGNQTDQPAVKKSMSILSSRSFEKKNATTTTTAVTVSASASATTKKQTKERTFFKRLFGGKKGKAAQSKKAAATTTSEKVVPLETTKDDEKAPTIVGSDDEQEKSSPVQEEAVVSEQAPVAVEPVGQ